MRKKNYKGRCEKQSLEKFTTICKTYDPIQSAYANILVKNKDVAEVRCNVPLDGDECGEYMTDFVCKKTEGDLMVEQLQTLLGHSQINTTMEYAIVNQTNVKTSHKNYIA